MPSRRLALGVLLLAGLAGSLVAHEELEALVHAPVTGTLGDYRFLEVELGPNPRGPTPSPVAWRLDLEDEDGERIRTWFGSADLGPDGLRRRYPWAARGGDGRPLGDGWYRFVLRAAVGGGPGQPASRSGASPRWVAESLGQASHRAESRALVHIGRLVPARLANHPGLLGARPGGPSSLSAPAPAGLPWTVYLGNLHSQTKHSDGGYSLSSSKANGHWGDDGIADADEAYQVSREAYEYADDVAGLDFLLTSEHNHYFDDSSRTNKAASRSHALARFGAGRQAAKDYSAAHPGFLALYGLEWGLSTRPGSGHVNILNPNELPAWERNDQGELLGHIEIAAGHYGRLYDVMKQRNWIGQFNHPEDTQFVPGKPAHANHPGAGEPLQATPSGIEAMALVEVANTSAKSARDDGRAPARTRGFVARWKELLENGYRLAPASNQDNHRKNWGTSGSNRTGVLLPQGAPFTYGAFLQAIRARRVFATTHESALLVLTADALEGDGQVMMGSEITNRGDLQLDAWFESSAGASATRATLYRGTVEKRNSTRRRGSTKVDRWTDRPPRGLHFYFVHVVADRPDDAKGNPPQAWSAPIWVRQLD